MQKLFIIGLMLTTMLTSCVTRAELIVDQIIIGGTGTTATATITTNYDILVSVAASTPNPDLTGYYNSNSWYAGHAAYYRVGAETNAAIWYSTASSPTGWVASAGGTGDTDNYFAPRGSTATNIGLYIGTSSRSSTGSFVVAWSSGAGITTSYTYTASGSTTTVTVDRISDFDHGGTLARTNDLDLGDQEIRNPGYIRDATAGEELSIDPTLRVLHGDGDAARLNWNLSPYIYGGQLGFNTNDYIKFDQSITGVIFKVGSTIWTNQP